MDSRIILSTADFSANNIGRYAELSDLTKKVLAKQTQYDADSAEAIALNTFLDNLIGDGFIGGDNPLLKTLVIPCLAGKDSGETVVHAQFLYDIAKLDENGYPTNIMAEGEQESVIAERVFEAVTDSNNHVIAMKRIYKEGNKANALIDSGLFKQIGEKYPSFSILAYQIGNISTSALSGNVFLSNNSVNYKVEMSFSRFGIYDVDNRYSVLATPTSTFKGFVGMTYDAVNRQVYASLSNGSIGETSITGDTNNLKVQLNSNIFKLGSAGYDADTHKEWSLIALGDGLTQTQLTTFKGYVDTLMTALHANV